MKTIITFLLFTISSFNSYSQVDCNILKEGSFVYFAPSEFDTIYVSIKGSKHVEYHQGGKYQIISKMKWISDCEYVATLKKTTIPDFPSKKGVKLHTKIIKSSDDRVLIEVSRTNESWQNVLFKINQIPKEVILK